LRAPAPLVGGEPQPEPVTGLGCGDRAGRHEVAESRFSLAFRYSSVLDYLEPVALGLSTEAGRQTSPSRKASMSKKMVVIGLLVVSIGTVALPAVASAQSWHLNLTTSFSVSGSGGTLTWASSQSLICTSTKGAGVFSTTTAGSVSMTFHGCTGPFGIACTSPGQPSGTVTFSASFDGIMVAADKPAILLTPTGSAEPTPGLKTLWEMSCFGILEKIFGKGIIGTISAPGCGTASSTATVAFESIAQGSQADKTYTGTTFDLASTLSTASHPTFSLDASWSLVFPVMRTMTCTS
jgi:hypothetical protein